MQLLEEQQDAVTFKGQPLTLVGKKLKVGDKAPDAEVTDAAMNKISLSSLMNRPCIILSVPSLDTPVCAKEARRFNEQIDTFNNQLSLITVSMDLPFAQSRWCAAENIKNIKVFSDYQSASFGTNYGVLIKQLHLLARAIFIVDKQRTIQHIHLVKEVTEEPDYEKILEEAKKVL